MGGGGGPRRFAGIQNVAKHMEKGGGGGKEIYSYSRLKMLPFETDVGKKLQRCWERWK